MTSEAEARQEEALVWEQKEHRCYRWQSSDSRPSPCVLRASKGMEAMLRVEIDANLSELV